MGLTIMAAVPVESIWDIRMEASMKQKATPQKASKAARKPGLRDLSTLEAQASKVKAGFRVTRKRK